MPVSLAPPRTASPRAPPDQAILRHAKPAQVEPIASPKRARQTSEDLVGVRERDEESQSRSGRGCEVQSGAGPSRGHAGKALDVETVDLGREARILLLREEGRLLSAAMTTCRVRSRPIRRHEHRLQEIVRCGQRPVIVTSGTLPDEWEREEAIAILLDLALRASSVGRDPVDATADARQVFDVGLVVSLEALRALTSIVWTGAPARASAVHAEALVLVVRVEKVSSPSSATARRIRRTCFDRRRLRVEGTTSTCVAPCEDGESSISGLHGTGGRGRVRIGRTALIHADD